jgi:DNA (cytosine-5)-methyltransferase 1
VGDSPDCFAPSILAIAFGTGALVLRIEPIFVVSTKGFDHLSRGAWMMFRVLSLFAGIGGFDLGLERTGGFRTVAFCEIESFAQAILRQHWPEVPIYGDVRELTATQLEADGIVPDVIVGGFPCQDVSAAGRRAGVGEGTRSGLYVELLRLARDIRPDFIVMENVSGLLSGPPEQPGGWFGRVLGDLAEIGYDAEWHCIPASYVGAWHRRDRVWILAYPHEECGQQRLAQGPLFRQRDLLQQSSRSFARWPGRSGLPASRICGRNDGVPQVPHRIAALGNAVTPQIVELIGRAILAAVQEQRRAA